MENIIKITRKKMGLTQEEFAERLGISVRTLQRYECAPNLKFHLFLKMMKILHIDPQKCCLPNEKKGENANE